MSNIENDILTKKDQNSSSLHFLDQLKDAILPNNEETKTNDNNQITNKQINENNENNYSLINKNETKEEKNKSKENEETKNNVNSDELNINTQNNNANDNQEKNNEENNDNNSIKDVNNGNNNTVKNDLIEEKENNESKENKETKDNIDNDEKKGNSDDNNNMVENNEKEENNVKDEITKEKNDNVENTENKEEENRNNDKKEDKKSEIDENSEITKGENNENTKKNIDEKENENLDKQENDLSPKENPESNINKTEKEEKHKISPSCLNECIKWTLKAEIKGKRQFPNDFKSKYTFPGSSVFFKKLDFSILNTLHNSLSMTKWNLSTNNLPHVNTHEILEHIKTESNNKLINSIKNKTSSSPIKDHSSSTVRELLNINYPIDNSKFNYSIIDANLCIKDNLKNIFLLEFDLNKIENIIDNINNEEELNKSNNNKDLRDIDDDCVEREIYFILNGTFHGNQVFKNDLTFSVEYREFIKSVQFRLQNYQNKIIEMSKKIKVKKNLFQNMQTNFFGKVLTNINLGIEFSKPQSHEIIQTNFNSIVNSHIKLNKILIELTIPNIFINNNKLNISNIFEGANEDSNSISTKKTSISSPKKEEENNNNNNSTTTNNNNNNQSGIKNKNTNYSDNYNNIMFNSNMTSPNTRTIGINRSIPASPHLNDFQKLIYQQKYSPLINNNLRNNNLNINNNFANPIQNSFFSSTPNYPRSPAPGLNPQQIFCSPQPNTYSPLSASLMMMQMPYMGRIIQQPMSINSPFNMSNYSSPYMGNNTNMNNNSGLNSSNQQRKCSDCFQEKIIIENPMNTIGRKIYNSNHQTPIMLKKTEEEPISRINLNQFMSPKSMGPGSTFTLGGNTSSFNLNNPTYNGAFYQLNPMNNINQMNQMGNMNQMGQGIPMTIRQKIFENAKKEEVERINKTLNSMNRVRTTNNNNINMNNLNNINNMVNINNINNFNNSNINSIRNNNIMKNNNINNMNMNNINKRNKKARKRYKR